MGSTMARLPAIRECRRVEGEACGRIQLDAADERNVDQYKIHPVLLDACLQLLGTTLPPSQRQSEAYVPVAVDAFRWHQPGGKQLWCHAVRRPSDQIARASAASFTGDLRLYDDQWHLVAEISGVQLRRVPRAFVTARTGFAPALGRVAAVNRSGTRFQRWRCRMRETAPQRRANG